MLVLVSRLLDLIPKESLLVALSHSAAAVLSRFDVIVLEDFLETRVTLHVNRVENEDKILGSIIEKFNFPYNKEMLLQEIKDILRKNSHFSAINSRKQAVIWETIHIWKEWLAENDLMDNACYYNKKIELLSPEIMLNAVIIINTAPTYYKLNQLINDERFVNNVLPIL